MTPAVLPLPTAQPGLIDRHGRSKHKLRLSLTDRCNFRCSYCMPDKPTWLPRASLLQGHELLRLARLAVAQGITDIRLTGGEPLLRADLLDCVKALQALREIGLQRLSMTTNAFGLATQAQALKAAGLDDLNISLDAVEPSRFQALTRQPLAPVMAGIDAAVAAGFPVKLNAVVLRGRNEDQILPLTAWAIARGLPLRFIEYMPLDAPGRWQRDDVVSEAEILARLRTMYRVEARPRGREPATVYDIDGAPRVGVIATVSNPFCQTCDRIRLTATGELYTCLFAATGTPLGARMRAGDDDATLTQLMRDAIWHKQAGYAATPGPVERPVLMYGMGG